MKLAFARQRQVNALAATRCGGKKVGYLWVSTLDQNTGRQLDGADLDKTFPDKASGKDAKAPEGIDSNWIPAEPNRKFELMFRAYAPTEALFQKT